MNTIIITIKQIASKLSKDSITSYAAQMELEAQQRDLESSNSDDDNQLTLDI